MLDWLEALFLGLVQGVTEFLPISSDGHLALSQRLFDLFRGRQSSGAENFFFDVMLHLGTLAAIVVHYRHVAVRGASGLLGTQEVPPPFRREAVVRVGLLALVATLPLVPDALFFKPLIEKAFTSKTAIGVGFLISAAVLGLTMRLKAGEKGPAETSYLDALLVGLAQALAPLPGVSRSGLTVATALALGFSRPWAVGFSLLLAVPAILGAAVFELRKVDTHLLTRDRVSQTVAALIVAGIVGYAAIRWLVRIVQSGRLWYFSVYLVLLGAAVLLFFRSQGDRSDAGRSKPVDRPVRVGVARPGVATSRRPQGRLDRPVAARPRPGVARLDAPSRRARPTEGVDLG